MSKPVNIAAIVPYGIFPAKMGGQKGIALFYTYLKKITPVTLFSTPDNQVPAAFENYFTPLLNSSRLRYINPFLFYKFRKEIVTNNFSHLILEHPYYAWLGLWLKRSTGIKLVVHSHNIESLRFKSTKKWWWKIMQSYEANLHRKADINFFITDEDRDYAISKFSLDAAKCNTITYGFDLTVPPALSDKQAARKKLQELHGILPNEKILFFNGTLYYKPNLDALDAILNYINPLLLKKSLHYKIIICGKGLPDFYDSLKSQEERNIIFAGFVDDIELYFKGADVFINPVTGGGGIKTKLVEAIGSDLSAVSTITGAIGVPQVITGKKMEVTPDGDWELFTDKIISINPAENTNQAFYDHFSWANIAGKALKAIERSV